MARKGESIKSLREKNPKGKRKVIPHAMTEYIAEGLERIAIEPHLPTAASASASSTGAWASGRRRGSISAPR